MAPSVPKIPNEKIEDVIKLNHNAIANMARNYGLQLEDANQEIRLYLLECPQLLNCNTKDMLDVFRSKLRKYAFPPYDAKTSAERLEDMAIARGCNSDEVVPAPKAAPIECWRKEDVPAETIDHITKKAAARPSGKKTAKIVLTVILTGTASSSYEVAMLVGISPRHARTIIEKAEKVAWSMH